MIGLPTPNFSDLNYQAITCITTSGAIGTQVQFNKEPQAGKWLSRGAAGGQGGRREAADREVFSWKLSAHTHKHTRAHTPRSYSRHTGPWSGRVRSGSFEAPHAQSEKSREKIRGSFIISVQNM
ncbi:unnamed protein product [Pleuronectes platessa]|uniref:Uncharacterized protein n=1 Tax=Pleuronectes platessa TaxID=8262 RepID=A0A9N7VPH4_PLEPL|nr:unnamed protein product [Pleuronectes platessa]